MKHCLTVALVFIGSFLFGQTDLQEKSVDFLNCFKAKDYAAAGKYFASELQSQIPDGALEKLWDQVVGANGKLKKANYNCQEAGDTTTTVYVTCKFKKNTFDAKVIFNSRDEVLSFLLVTVYSCEGKQEVSKWTPPEYHDPYSYTEGEVTIENDGYKMPGTLVLPKEDYEHILIFVHGSGPNDRDESYGPNKMFKDLALGFAANGIGSLRYDKRTKANVIRNANEMTLFDEVLDDVDAAVQWIRSNEKLKDKKIIVLGHSLGAMLIPYTGANNKDVSGIIMMAGPAGKFEDLLVYQYNYLLKLDGELSKEDQATLQKMQAQAMNVKALTDTTTQADLPMGLPPKYWMSFNKFEQTKYANESTLPFLIMNGERDYQVPMIEFEGWKEALKNRTNVTFNSYPKLNHFFFEGEGTPGPGEYQIETHVPNYVIKSISEWVKLVK